jgi:class 3 adenylate cyclase
MVSKTQHYRWEFEVDLPREKLWRYLANSNRTNYNAGFSAFEYEYEPVGTGGSLLRGRAKAGGMDVVWVESPAVWVEPEYFVVERTYSKGPMSHLLARHEFYDGDAPGKSRVVYINEITPRNALTAMALKAVVGKDFKRSLEWMIGEAQRWAETGIWPQPPDKAVALNDRARHLLDERLPALGEKIGELELATRLAAHLKASPSMDVARLYPYLLADLWGVDRHRLLGLMLHATQSGVLDMLWVHMCPSCRLGQDPAPDLSKITAEGQCDSCNLEFEVDFEGGVEVVFTPEPLGIDVKPMIYCHSGPMSTPHRMASCLVPQGDATPLKVNLRKGMHQLNLVQGNETVYFDVVDDDDTAVAADIKLSRGKIEGMPSRVKAGSLTLMLHNETGDPNAHVKLERASWDRLSATAAEITTLADFRDLFSHEILAPGMDFTIQSLTFLFTDVVGSTAMYEKIGDATAFSLVRQHFDLLFGICKEHRGSKVKTIGDAVMAVFRDPEDALNAALQMHARVGEIKDERSGHALSLRIGVHEGPCITVSANDLLDYFGTTVNTAARVEGQAQANELSFSIRLADTSVGKEILKKYADTIHESEVTLKGLAEPVKIFRVVVGGSAS